MTGLVLTPTIPRSRSAQALAKARGDQGEAVVTMQHQLAALRGIGHVIKVPTPTVGRQGALRFCSRSTVDYYGVLRGGQAVVAECKRVATGRWQRHFVADHQAAALDQAHHLGALALLLIVYGPQCQLYAVPWYLAREWRGAGPAELADFRVAMGDCYLAKWVQL